MELLRRLFKGTLERGVASNLHAAPNGTVDVEELDAYFQNFFD